MQYQYRVRKKRRPIRVYKTSNHVDSTQIYKESDNLDRMSITQQIREHPEVMKERFETAGASRYQALLHSIFDAVFITDLLGNIFEVNARAEHQFGRVHDELCRINIVHMISGADRDLLDVLVENVGDRKYTVLEGYCVRADGSKFFSEITVTRLRTREKGALCFFVRDITERKKSEDQLKAATEHLLETESENARLGALSSLYHELNNPLQVLTCMAELENNEEYKTQLAEIIHILNKLRDSEASNDEKQIGSGSEDSGIKRVESEDVQKCDFGRILVVDDDERLVNMFSRILSYYFPELIVDIARDGREAAEKFGLYHHGLITMDMAMPVMSGDQAYEQIEELCHVRKWQLPYVIFLTGFDVSDELEHILGDGSCHLCLKKPLSMSKLVDAMREQMAKAGV